MARRKNAEHSAKRVNYGEDRWGPGKPTASRPARRSRRKVTRDSYLLVKDQDIFDLVNSMPIDQMKVLAGRFAVIASIIRAETTWPAGAVRIAGTSRAAKSLGDGEERAAAADQMKKIEKIERIGRESRAKGFRKIVSAIKQGLGAGRDYTARTTALAVVAEAFHNTGDYFRAFDEFCAAVLAMRKR